MGKVTRTERARADLSAIWDYIALDDPKAATKFLRKLEDRILTLSDAPQIGRSRSADLLIPGLRSFPVNNYVIYYCPLKGGGVNVVRVFHAARDIGGMLDDQ